MWGRDIINLSLCIILWVLGFPPVPNWNFLIIKHSIEANAGHRFSVHSWMILVTQSPLDVNIFGFSSSNLSTVDVRFMRKCPPQYCCLIMLSVTKTIQLDSCIYQRFKMWSNIYIQYQTHCIQLKHLKSLQRREILFSLTIKYTNLATSRTNADSVA